MPTDFADHNTRVTLARLTGGLYLAYIAASVLADKLGHIGLGTAQQLYQATLASEMPFRAGLVTSLVSALLFALVAWGLYVLLRPVNGALALLFLLLNAIGVAIQCASVFPLISTMLQGAAGSSMQAFTSAQLAGMGVQAAGTYKLAWVTAQLFFGTWLFPLGYLVYKSRSLPRWLGVLLLADGVAVMIWFLQAMLFPAYRVVSMPGLAVSFVAEFGLALWLLIMGVREGAPSQEFVERGPSAAPRVPASVS